MIPRGALGIVLAASTSCAVAQAPAGSEQRSLQVGGLTRTYHRVVPPACLSTSARCSLVFGFHGGGVRGVSGAQFDRQSNLSQQALRRGFIIVLPDAQGVNWNDGRPEVGQGADDVAFVKTILAKLGTEKLGFDPTRVYATGMSNGGHMSFRLACEMADVFRAVAPVSASLGTVLAARCTPSRPVNVLNIVGTADPLSRFAGGMMRLGNGKPRGEILSSDATFAFWAKANGCNGQSVRTEADRDRDDATSVVMERYTSCAGGTVVERRIVVGGGHIWPGNSPTGIIARISGPATEELDATDVVLDFFEIQKAATK